MNRANFVELKGRGGWHQIDCPFDYDGFIPFLYPVRLLGEAKFLQKEVQKNSIRSFIGVLKDIQENYFVDDSLTDSMVRGRRMELGAFFAANGFNPEAEKLAYAHGIRTCLLYTSLPTEPQQLVSFGRSREPCIYYHGESDLSTAFLK